MARKDPVRLTLCVLTQDFGCTVVLGKQLRNNYRRAVARLALPQ